MEDYQYEYTPEEQQQLANQFWNQYNQADNSVMANMLRDYTPANAQAPKFIGLDQKERLAKMLEGNNYQQPTYQRSGSQMQMPNVNMNMLGGGASAGGSFGADTTLPATTSATKFSDGNAAFGSTGTADVTGNSFVGSQMDNPNFTPSAGGMYDSGGTQWFGNGGELGGGWASAAGGALMGYNQGAQNYRDDPNMWSGKDGYGKYHKDYRAEVGGGTLGGVMGYWGGPVGAALAGPTVKAVHPYAEKGTRAVINAGDKVGGAGGALMVDPIGTVSTGKYSWGELGKGALLGPAQKWLGW